MTAGLGKLGMDAVLAVEEVAVLVLAAEKVAVLLEDWCMSNRVRPAIPSMVPMLEVVLE